MKQDETNARTHAQPVMGRFVPRSSALSEARLLGSRWTHYVAYQREERVATDHLTS